MQIVTIEYKNDEGFSLWCSMTDENLVKVSLQIREAIDYSSTYFADGFGLVHVTLYDNDGNEIKEVIANYVYQVFNSLWGEL